MLFLCKNLKKIQKQLKRGEKAHGCHSYLKRVVRGPGDETLPPPLGNFGDIYRFKA